MKTFELRVSWTMTSTVRIEAETEEEATRSADTMRRPDDGDFLPFSLDVDSIEEVNTGKRAPARLLRVK